MKQLKTIKYLISFLISVTFLVACKKDKVECPTELSSTKWEQIAGDYKVYDTLGVYLYDMSLVHIYDAINDYDSIAFHNFNGQFDFTIKQSAFSGNPELYTHIGNIDTLFDSLSNRSKILINLDEKYNNVFFNDTIRFGFIWTNINYYLLDLVPFYSCDCKQIAVKQ